LLSRKLLFRLKFLFLNDKENKKIKTIFFYENNNLKNENNSK
jgi:hypothetical protein